MKPQEGKFIYYPETWTNIHGRWKELFFYTIRKKDQWRWDVFRSASNTPIKDDCDEGSLFDAAEPFLGNLDRAKKKVIKGILK